MVTQSLSLVMNSTLLMTQIPQTQLNSSLTTIGSYTLAQIASLQSIGQNIQSMTDPTMAR